MRPPNREGERETPRSTRGANQERVEGRPKMKNRKTKKIENGKKQKNGKMFFQCFSLFFFLFLFLETTPNQQGKGRSETKFTKFNV